MKYPKDKTTIYSVIRIVISDSYYSTYEDSTIVGSFRTAEEADNYKGACEQAFIDAKVTFPYYKWEMEESMYYDV